MTIIKFIGTTSLTGVKKDTDNNDFKWCASCSAAAPDIAVANCIACVSAATAADSYCTKCAAGTYLKKAATCPAAGCATCVDMCGAVIFFKKKNHKKIKGLLYKFGWNRMCI